MGRPVDTARREQVVDDVAAFLVRHGLEDASLKRVAAAAGTSDRMLVHYFGSRDALIEAALELARSRQLAEAAEALEPGEDAVALLRGSWGWYSAPRTIDYFRLFQQVAAMRRMLRVSEPAHRRELEWKWRPLLVPVFEADARFGGRAHEAADVCGVFLRGLSLQLTAGTQPGRVRPLFDAFLEMVEASA